MRTIRFGRTEARVSAVSVGSWSHGGPKIVRGRSVGWFGANDRLVHMTLVEAHAAGINHWDTADVYGDGHAERLLGQAWRQVPREDIFLATKVGWDPGPYGHYYHPEQIRRQLERSLRNLRTDYVDLYYLHHCDFGPDGEYLDTALTLLHRFRDEGKLRFIGLSDWSNEKLMRYVPRVTPEVVQCYRNVVDDTYDSSGLAGWVGENDAGVAFFSPFKHGLLLGLYEGPVTFGLGDHRNHVREFRDYGLLSRLRACRAKVEERFPDRPAPVLDALIGVLLSGHDSASVIAGAHRPSQVTALAAAGEPLSEQDADWLRRLYRDNGRPTRAAWKMRAQGA